MIYGCYVRCSEESSLVTCDLCDKVAISPSLQRLKTWTPKGARAYGPARMALTP